MAAERRAGFALVFVVVALAVAMILGTVVLLNTSTAQQRARVQAVATALRRFEWELGTAPVQPTYRGDVRLYPLRLSYLFAKIATTDRNACGVVYAGADVGRWAGPYHLVPMLRANAYQVIPGVVVQDSLERTPTSGPQTQAAVLSLRMNNVALQDAQDIGLAFDGISTGAGPRITFTPGGSTPVTVRYNINIVGC
jgi:hypothetical protein